VKTGRGQVIYRVIDSQTQCTYSLHDHIPTSTHYTASHYVAAFYHSYTFTCSTQTDIELTVGEDRSRSSHLQGHRQSNTVYIQLMWSHTHVYTLHNQSLCSCTLPLLTHLLEISTADVEWLDGRVCTYIIDHTPCTVDHTTFLILHNGVQHVSSLTSCRIASMMMTLITIRRVRKSNFP